jgi:hypothetical protein
MKLTRLLLILAALSLPVFGQTTTYTGTIKDLSGAVVTSGNVTFTLTPSIDTTISGISRFVPLTTTCSISGTGTVVALDGVSPCTVTQNTALTPTGTSYKVCLQPYFTSPGSCFIDYAVTSSKDITTVAPTPALSPSYNYITQSALAAASVAHATTADTATSVLKDAILDKGFVNAVKDCAVPSDTTTDAYATLQACLDANRGNTVCLPKLTADTVNTKDYTISQTLIMHGNGSSLVGCGGGHPRWFYGTKLKFPTNVTGIKIASDCTNCTIANLDFEGSDSFEATDITTWEDWTTETDFRGDSGLADCIRVMGGEYTIEYVGCGLFKRHGAQVIGTGAGGQPDLGRITGLMCRNDRAYCFYSWGSDSNVAIIQSLNSLTDGLGAVSDNAFYGNTFIAPHTNGSGTAWTIAAGTNKTIAAASGLVVASNVLTITTTTAHGWALGTWVTSTGSTDGTFNGTCKLLTVPTTTTATCAFTHADGNTANGTVATSTGVQIRAVYTARTIDLVNYKSTSTAGSSTFIAPYSEATAGSPSWGQSLVLNGQGTAWNNAPSAGNHIIGHVDGNMYFRAPNFNFGSPTSGNGITLTQTDRITFAIKMTNLGNITAIGPIQKFGATTGSNNGVNLDNAYGLYFQKADHTGNARGVYFHTDNVMHLCDASFACHVDSDNFHINGSLRTNVSANTDLAGTLTLVAGAASFTFTKGPYSIAPICVASDTTATNVVKVSVTTTVMSLTGTGTDVINYICIGRT